MTRRIQIGLTLAIGAAFVLTIAHYEHALETLDQEREREIDALIEEADEQLRGVCREIDPIDSQIYSDMDWVAQDAIRKDPHNRLHPPSGNDFGLMMRCLPLYVGRKGWRRIQDEYRRRDLRVVEGFEQDVSAEEHNARMMNAWRFLYDEYRRALEIRPSLFALQVRSWIRRPNLVEKEW